MGVKPLMNRHLERVPKSIISREFSDPGVFPGSAKEFVSPDGNRYELFKQRVAELLGTIPSAVDIFTVLDSTTKPGYTDVRFTAHGSPYYNDTKLLGVISADSSVSHQSCHPRLTASNTYMCTHPTI